MTVPMTAGGGLPRPPEAAAQTEYARRRAALAVGLQRMGADLGVLWSPASVCYFSGNDVAGANALLLWPDGRAVVVAEEYDAVNFERLADPQLQLVPYRYTEDLWSAVVIHLRRGPPMRTVATEFADLRAVAWRQLTEELHDVRLVALDAEVRRCRLVKSEAELSLIRRSAAIVGRTLATVAELLAGPTTEAEVAATIYRELILAGSTHVGSQPYVKSGPRALLTHARWSERAIQPGDHVLVELAASSGRYHAALMRTRLARIRSMDYDRAVAAVVAGRDAYLQYTRPGRTAGDVHDHYLAVLRSHGVDGWNRHASGYSLGLGFAPVWGEVPLLMVSRGTDVVLAPGMVFHLISGLTEPSKGVPHVGLSECVLVTAKGCQTLVDAPDFL